MARFKKGSTTEAETILAIVTTSTYNDAAEQLGITIHGLMKRRKKFGIDEKINQMPIDALTRLKIGSVRAANELVTQLEDKDVKNRNKAANDVLGYTLGKGDKPEGLKRRIIAEEFFSDEGN